ncbi:MAG: hypothetical protein E2O58_08800 [Gammaproteobacteria bacterium]|nr:MAG: hypothetical protein E2O58_08800 [Gammaproteobacteria bacterium]
MGFSSITEAPNGAVFASRFGRSGSMVVFGGGHNAYFGSDVHAFDLEHGEWSRVSTGFVAGEPNDYGESAHYPDSVYPDGFPLPPHTYDYVQYDEVGNDFLLLKGQTQLGPAVQAIAIPHLFNLDTLTWRHGPNHPSVILNAGGFTAWDAARRLLWGHSGDEGGGNAFVAFSPDGLNEDGTVGRWTEFHPSKLPGEANHNAMQLLPEDDRLVIAVHARNAFGTIDLGVPEQPLAMLTATEGHPPLREYAALEYSRELRKLVYYSALDGAAVYAVSLEAEVHWSLLTRGDFDPIADAERESKYCVNRAHTFGRFRVASYADCELAILVRHVDSPVYALRLPTA